MARKSTAQQYAGEFAYCWRSGELEFGKHLPDGALLLGRGTGKKWRDQIEVMCRLAYDGKTYLIPGVSEADNDNAALEAVQRFVGWLRQRDEKRARLAA